VRFGVWLDKLPLRLLDLGGLYLAGLARHRSRLVHRH
jgi:hypothetical protein